MDFTLCKYIELVKALKAAGYSTLTYADSQRKDTPDKYVVLRHDIDLDPGNALQFAKAENELGIRATYYFRAVPQSWDDDVIRQIAAMGHEVGYHYESMTTCDGNPEAAYDDFCNNLERLRALTPVSTICMHGSPRSRYDSRELWRDYDYHELGIVGEPYLDTDFSRMFYLTDTGRRWDGFLVSVRDKIPVYQDLWVSQGLVFHTTDQLIQGIKDGKLPKRIMMTTHPQRWNEFGVKWLKEYVMQHLKNIVKKRIAASNAT